MKTMELARKLAEYKQKTDALRAYLIALQQGGLTPEEELEAASYIFFSKGDYQVAYTTFLSLFRRGYFQAELLNLLSQAFYYPNLPAQKRRYEENCRLLAQYPYCFRKDFLPFEDLPILFFPFEKRSYIPYDPQTNTFGDFVDFDNPVIDRYFFKDLENPILAQDVYSQYQLEYLNDTVRKSEWVARENHIYLHYTDWVVFCSHLQCLDFKVLLRDKKFVFLFEEEVSQYPIDFKERFGIDYSQHKLRPIGIREVNRLIWHTQLATHNGGDFFNEIFYDHPNLLASDSIMLDNVEDVLKETKKRWKQDRTQFKENGFYQLMLAVKNPTEKDFMVGTFLTNPRFNRGYDHASRIVPAIFFQPHFSNLKYELHSSNDYKACILFSEQYEKIQKSPLFQQFKYIKTFVPMRRITTSHAASVRFAYHNAVESEESAVLKDMLAMRVLNRSFMVDPDDRLYKDSILVRFEDGKLNPKATFTALAEFLDIPYTESMTYCSNPEGINMPSMVGNVLGFDTATVYRTYDDYANDNERAYLEFFMRDAYKCYGYDFHYYHGETVDKSWIEDKLSNTECIDKLIADTCRKAFETNYRKQLVEQNIDPNSPENSEKLNKQVDIRVAITLESYHQNRVTIGETLLNGLHFVNKNYQPLRMLPLLKLDPDLLEQPLYH